MCQADPMPEMICRNCGNTSDPAHYDLCCLCFCIAFGAADHDAEHRDPNATHRLAGFGTLTHLSIDAAVCVHGAPNGTHCTGCNPDQGGYERL